MIRVKGIILNTRKGEDNMKQISKNRIFGFKFLILLSMLFSILFSSLTVFAERSDVDAVVTMQPGQSEVASVCAQANATVGVDILVYTGDDGMLTFSNRLYSELEMEQKREFMRVALAATKETSLGVQQQNKLYNFIYEQDNAVSAAVKYLQSDTSADFVAAKEWFRPFSSPLSTIMGVLCLLIFIFMGLSIVFDVAYLALPFFQGLLERGEERKRPIGVSREAWAANREVETDEKHRGVFSIYLGKRIPAIILMSLCLGYVISGYIYDIVIYFIDAFSSIHL